MGLFVNIYERSDAWKLDTVMDITSKIKTWADSKGITDVILNRVEDNTWSDPVNMRYDIEISYTRGTHMIMQKLLMLKGEIIDGQEFHDRFEEFYPDHVA